MRDDVSSSKLLFKPRFNFAHLLDHFTLIWKLRTTVEDDWHFKDFKEPLVSSLFSTPRVTIQVEVQG